MVSKHNKMELFQKQVNKAKRYTLKKLTIGLASVAVGAVLFLGQSGDVYAAEEGENGVVSIQVVGGDLTVHETPAPEVSEPETGSIDISVSGGDLQVHEDTPALDVSTPPVESTMEDGVVDQGSEKSLNHEAAPEANPYVGVARERADQLIGGMNHLTREEKTAYLNRVKNASSVGELEVIYEEALRHTSGEVVEKHQPDTLNPNQYVPIVRERAVGMLGEMPHLSPEDRQAFLTRVNEVSSVEAIEAIVKEAEGYTPYLKQPEREGLESKQPQVTLPDQPAYPKDPQEAKQLEDLTSNVIHYGQQEVKTQEITDYEVDYRTDPNLYVGQYKILIPGVRGVKEIVRLYETANGEITSHLLQEKVNVISEMKKQVVVRGTKPIEGVEETVTEEVISPSEEVVYSSDLYVGEVERIPGTPGLKRVTKVYKTVKGQRTNEVLETSEQTLIEAVPTIVYKGVKSLEGTKEVVTKEVIQPETIEDTDDGLYEDEQRVVEGSVGRQQITTTYRTHKGELTGEVVNVSKETLEDAQPTIIYRGTKPVQGTREVVTEATIQPETQTIETDALYVDDEEVTEGSTGRKQITTTYKTHKGELTDEVVNVSENVLEEAQPKIIRQGTKPVQGTKEVVTEEVIQPETIEDTDDGLYEDEQRVVEGSVGRQQITTTYRTRKGELTDDVVNVSKETLEDAQPTIIYRGTKPVQGTREVVTEATIQPETQTIETDALYVGDEEVTEGSTGRKQITTTYKTHKGELTEEVVSVFEKTLEEVQPKIIRQGTKSVQGTKEVVTEEVIQPETIEDTDDGLYEDEQRVVEGSVGRQQITTTYRTHKGELTDEVVNVSKETLEDAQPTIIYRGTKPVQGVQDVVTEDIIQPETQTIETDALYVGEEEVTEGKAGRKQITTTYKTHKGELTEEVVSVSEETLEEAQPKIIRQGTKPVQGTKEVVTEEMIQPETIEDTDDGLYEDEQRVVEGSVGRQQITTTYRTHKGELTDEVVNVSKETLEDAQPTIIYRGTKPVQGVQDVVTEDIIQPETQTIETDALYVGEEEVTEGKAGRKQITTTYKTHKGELTEEVVSVSEETLEEAQPKIIRQGTKPVQGTKEVVTEEMIQPETIEDTDDGLYEDEQRVVEGSVGRQQITTTYRTHKGELTDEVVNVSKETLEDAQPTIIYRGTKPVQGVQDVVTEDIIQPETQTIETDALYVGEEEVTEGKAGRKQITTTYKTHKGELTEEVVSVSEETLEEARPTIVYKGTKAVEGSKDIVTEVEIEPDVQTIQTDDLYEGEEDVTEGTPGRKRVTTMYRTHKGEITSDVLNVSEETLVEAQPKIIRQGTKAVHGTEDVVTYETIQPEEQVIQTDDLYVGEEEVTEGKAGRKQITTTYKTHKGTRTEEVVNVSTETLEEAQSKIIRRGSKPVQDTREVVTYETIEPDVQTIQTDELYEGEEEVTEGTPGRQQITTTYRTNKGELTDEVITQSEQTLEEAKPKIIRQGTKAAHGTEDVVTYETIQPDIREETDNNLYVGEERTVDGSVGRRQITTTYKTHKGKRTDEVVNVSRETIEEARPTVVYKGTKSVEGTEEVVTTEVIEPGTTEETDDGLYEGEQRVVQGSPGRREVTTTYRTRKGKRTDEVVNRSERTLEAAQPTITYVGTKPVEGTEDVVTYEPIQPEEQVIQTSELYEGDEEVTEGTAGRKEITTTYKTHKGKRTDEVTNVSTRTLEEAQPKIVRQGTKPVNGREEVVTEETIEPEIIERDDNTLLEGEIVSEEGQPGTRRITKVYKTVRGKRTDEVLEESSDVIKEATPTIVRKGVRFEAPTLDNAHFTSDAMNRTARLSYTLNNPSNLEVSGMIRVSRDGEAVRDVQVSNFNEITIDNLDVNTPYQFEARLTYTRNDESQDVVAHTDTHTLSMNQLELKSIGRTTLVRREADGQLREFSELHEKPSDLSTYYIRAQASNMKDIVMPVSSIEEVQKDGETVYAVKTASDETVHRDGDVFKPGSVFYVNKYKAPENGVYYNFKDLIHAMSNNPRGNFILGRTVSAAGVEPLGRKTYIQTDFRGTLSGLHNGKRHRIEGLEHGLFTKVNGGQIKDIDFTGVNIVYPDSWEGDYISSLAGDLTNGGVIENVNVQGYIEGRDNVSGLVNTISNKSRVENVSFIGRIKSKGGNSVLGGIAGINNRSIVKRAYVDADVEMHRPQDASLLVAINISNQGDSHKWGQTTQSVVKGSMRSNIRGKMAAISTSTWGYATVSDVVSYATIQNGHELFGADEQLTNPDAAYKNIKGLYGVKNVSSGSVKGEDRKFDRLELMDAVRKERSFNLTAIDALNRATPAEEINGSRRYNSVSGYVASNEAFYRFVEALQPFGLVEDIVREGNTLAQSNKRPSWMAEGKELKSITALKGHTFMTHGDDADRIMLQFTDGTKVIYGLSQKKALDLYKDTRTTGNPYGLSAYHVDELGVTYTLNRLSRVPQALVQSLVDELRSVELYNNEMYQMLKINEKTEQAKENRMKKLFLDEIFDATKAELQTIMEKLLQNDMVMLADSDVAQKVLRDKVATHKKQIMMALTYLNRYYNIRFGEYTIKDLMMYLPEFYSGQGGSLIDRLIKLGSSTEYQLYGRRTHEFFNREFGAAIGTDLLDFLDFNRELFTEFDNMNDWFKDATKENVKLIEMEPLAEGLKAQNPKYRVFDNLSHSYYQHTILPLLNLRKAKLFMISTIASLTFGSEQKRAYLNDAQLQKELEHAGNRHRDFIDSWYKIANKETRDRLMRDQVTPIWEGFDLKERGWVNEFGKDNRGQDYAPSREFYNVIGEYYGSNGTGAYANGTLIHFVAYDYLGEGGHATWTHEMTHNYDGLVFLGGSGRRNGVGAEAYASGMLQSPGQNGGGYGSLGINLSYSWEDDGENIYNSDPKKFHNQAMWDKYMKGYNDALTLLDYLEGEAAINAGKDVQRHWFKKMGKTDVRETRFTDHVRPITEEEWNSMSLQSVDDLVDNQLLTQYGLNNGTYSQDNDWGTYVTIPYLTGIYGGGNNSIGVPGAAMFKHNTFRVWGRYGYENGFVGYASNKHREQALNDGHAQLSDDYAIKKISGGEHETMEDFKKDYFNDMITQLKTKGMIDIQIDGVQYSSYDSLAKKFSQTVQADTEAKKHDHTRTFKGKLFKALLHSTDNFLSSIFKG